MVIGFLLIFIDFPQVFGQKPVGYELTDGQRMANGYQRLAAKMGLSRGKEGRGTESVSQPYDPTGGSADLLALIKIGTQLSSLPNSS